MKPGRLEPEKKGANKTSRWNPQLRTELNDSCYAGPCPTPILQSPIRHSPHAAGRPLHSGSGGRFRQLRTDCGAVLTDFLVGPSPIRRMSNYVGSLSTNNFVATSAKHPILAQRKMGEDFLIPGIHHRLPRIKEASSFRERFEGPFPTAREALNRPHFGSFEGYHVVEPYSWSLTRK